MVSSKCSRIGKAYCLIRPTNSVVVKYKQRKKISYFEKEAQLRRYIVISKILCFNGLLCLLSISQFYFNTVLLERTQMCNVYFKLVTTFNFTSQIILAEILHRKECKISVNINIGNFDVSSKAIFH